MQDFFKKHDITWKKIFKIVGLTLAGLVVAALFISIVSATVRSLNIQGAPNVATLGMKSVGLNYASEQAAPSYGAAGMGASYDSSGVSLSTRNVVTSSAAPDKIIVPPGDQTVPGSDAEEFEVTEYGVSIETRNKDRDCATLAALKAKDYVIFESAYDHDRGCNYVFKVKKENSAEILAVIKSLNPKYLNESTYTIKKQIEDFTSQEDILKSKLDSVNKTLADAMASYDEISDVATQSRNADALAKIIDSKVQLIERLASQRINISSQMEQLARAKSEQLDRLAYTRFSVSVYESKFIDWKQIKDSWKGAVQNFVREVNQIIQDISINLLAVILTILQYAIYILILVVVVKYGWRGIKWIWKK